MTMTMTTTADADAYANAPQQQQQQQQLPQQQWRNGKRWGVSTSKDLRGAGFGYVGGKQRPGNGGNDDRGGIVPAGPCRRQVRRGPRQGSASPPPPPLPPRAIDSTGGATRQGVLPPGGARGQIAATKGEFKSP